MPPYILSGANLLSDNEKKLFAKLWNSGFKEEEIARILGIHVNMVPIYARVLDLPPRSKRTPPNKKLSDEDIELMKEMWLDGATIQEIANYFNVHYITVQQYLHAMGLKRRTRTKCPDIPRDKLEELSKQGLTDEEIARIFKTKKYCIARLRQKYGINKRVILKRKREEKINKIIETIANIIGNRGYTTSIELREKYGIRVNRKTLDMIEQSIEGIKWFRLTSTSTVKFTVFPAKFNNMAIIYLEGYEHEVIKFLKSNLKNKNVPSRVLKILLKMNRAPQELIEKIY